MPPPLPPGRRGLPLLGETLGFLKDGYAFVERRQALHGPVFRTRIAGRETAVIVGPDACRVWIDPEKIQRQGSMPGNVQKVFGGRSLPLLDGDQHRERKAQVLAGFAREVLPAYVDELVPLVRASLARWASAGEVGAVEETKRLAMEGICRNVLGLEPGPVSETLRAEYRLITRGVAALPVNLPGTTYHRALQARDRVFALFDDLIRRHRAQPSTDGLTRILEAGGPGGGRISDESARLELHHVVVAGYIIYAELVAAILYLDRDPDALARLRAEVRALPVAERVSAAALLALPHLQRVVMETKRLCPILPAIFGKAKTTFEFAGHTIPAGWMVLWAIRSTHMDPAIYTDPARFDPDRFSPERAEHLRHEHAFVPHGPGGYEGHACPGTQYATLFMSLVLAELARGYTWSLPAQDTSYVWSATPPEPRDGLRLSLRRIAPPD